MAHDVFISYSTPDRVVADAVCAALEALNRCWIAPRDVLAGTDYGEAILNAIEDCLVMVLVFSEHANGSPHVRREVERAVSKGKIIVPFRIENVPPSKSMEYGLSTTQWLEAWTPPLEMRIAELVECISRLLPMEQPRSHDSDNPQPLEMLRTDDAKNHPLAHAPEVFYRNRRGQSILMVQTFARDPRWPDAVYHISESGGERRALRHCLRVFGNRVGPVPEEIWKSCIANAVENILPLAPSIVGFGGMGEAARQIWTSLVSRGFNGTRDYWGGDVGIDATEFLRRNEVQPPF
ncbi:MAG TPA: toll/interleukin-1 receptor domain-containing protein [Verrucomicrobiota bacterium]|nr:hypothetical protein [Verrucomicrobiales bacterium]HRI14913.1 toll/interleukin-1 receptor domain-containing protein [Verrucomicrobiota bacterium]